MGGIDKLDAIVAGLPVLAHSIRAIAAAPEIRRIFVVASPERIGRLSGAQWVPAKVAAFLTGGARRQDSVAVGFERLRGTRAVDGGEEPDVVLVHDGARPLVSTALVSAIAHAARRHGAAIPVLAVGDTIKRIAADGSVSDAGDRAELAAAQTPQGIRTDVLRAAYAAFPADGSRTFTDEAALLEACKLPVHGIPGDERNFKVTLPGDLDRVRAAVGSTATRVGYGTDSHPFGPGNGLALGGVLLEGAPRLSGHSDGDVVLHAVADALLGAAGLGDLGRIFPAGPRTPRGIASSELLGDVAGRIAAGGLRVSSVDCTIVAGRPRLADSLPAIGERIAAILGVDPAAINVKASTGNLDGMEGAGRGISAHAVAVLAPRSSGDA
ncbi:MAG: 2-C-methyl-D-erythritol 4-phosphate cytidylyltransferase [Chloroflexota bacterium]|nr:2-C-methyl-D-erythritol 4-phosphate cytidylyltransferase [Chloroflexota bacterium]